MKLKLLLSLLFMTQISFSQKKITDLEKMNLKGDIVSIKTIEKKMPSIIVEGSDFNSRKEINFYVFNKNGYIIEEKSIVRDQFDSKKKKYYNSLNQISKVETYDSEDNLELDKNFEYEYDNNGEINKITYSNSPSVYRNELIKKGNIKTFIRFEFNDEKVESKTFERIENEKGKVIEDNYYIRDKLYSKTLQSYDIKGLLSRKKYSQYWNGKETINIEEYLYNKNNDIIKITTLDENNNIVNEENVIYVYDKKGNWIRKDSQGSEIITTERNIDYIK
ncbi:hypothetical protein [Flavobacterium hydatis]|uniref:Sugar-binding protein n=1 Tax=Flavobacterium hydatis TaxID=991 RepID=A0A086A0Y8_FLAHY|nr:hypothetical protein [Flavobacterium hydatis]KFF10352.1 hypothetical protein IW20_21025 [Flavobacterium hydatis]OXA92658.1 hypothetical protein B0A62_14745 [Flavobacterium hydatis]